MSKSKNDFRPTGKGKHKKRKIQGREGKERKQKREKEREKEQKERLEGEREREGGRERGSRGNEGNLFLALDARPGWLP